MIANRDVKGLMTYVMKKISLCQLWGEFALQAAENSQASLLKSALRIEQ